MENQNQTPQVFEHSHFGKLRVLIVDGVPYFVGKDVANSLGYKNTSEAVRNHVDNSLVLDSQLPLAKEYRHWVTSVVLPKVDEQGFFIREDMPAAEPTEPKVATVYVLGFNSSIKIGITGDLESCAFITVPSYRNSTPLSS